MISIFQVVLLVLVAIAIFYFMVLVRRSAIRRLFVGGFFGLVALAVLFPDATTLVAHAVGIGRGVDFVVYIAVFFLVVAVFQLQLRLNQQDTRITLLVRELALRAPVQPRPELSAQRR